MTRLKLSGITDTKRIKFTIELPSRLHSDLVAHGVVLNGSETDGAPMPQQVIAPMLERFIATDREFAKARRASQPG